MNTISTYSYRRKYRLATLDALLRKALVAEKVCVVDRTGLKYIDSPYGNQPTATVQSIAGTYSVTAFTLTDDTLTVADEVIYSEHVYDFEETLTKFNVWASRMDEQNNAIATAIDKWVLNELCERGNATYSTPAGGFTTAANIPVIMSNLLSKVAGYADVYRGLYIVIENTDVPGFVQSGAASGFNFADSGLNVHAHITRGRHLVISDVGLKNRVYRHHRHEFEIRLSYSLHIELLIGPFNGIFGWIATSIFQCADSRFYFGCCVFVASGISQVGRRH